MLKRGLCLLLFVLFAPCIWGEEQFVLRRHTYLPQRDMGQTNLNSMLQDSCGYLWIAAWNGLVRFDGYDFVTFNSQPGDSIHLDNNRITKLQLTGDGDIACSTYDGKYYLFDMKEMRFVSRLADMPNDTISYPSTEASGSGIERDIRKLPADLLQSIQSLRNKTSVSFPILAFRDKQQHWWVQLTDGQLFTFDSAAGTLDAASIFVNGVLQPLHTNAKSAMLDKQGNLWHIDEDNALHCLTIEPRKYTALTNPLGLKPRALMKDHLGRLWVGWKSTTGVNMGAISLFDSAHHLIGYIHEQGAITNDLKSAAIDHGIYCIYEDSRHCVWVGTRFSGLLLLIPKNKTCRQYETRHLKTGDMAGSLPANAVYDITEDHTGRLWIATFGGGVAYLPADRDVRKELRFRTIEASDNRQSPADKSVKLRTRDLELDTKNHLIVSTEAGLMVCHDVCAVDDSLTFSWITADGNIHSLCNNSVMHVKHLTDGRLLVSTSGGLDVTHENHLLAPYSFNHVINTELALGGIYSTHYDNNGAIWIVSKMRCLQYTDSLTFVQEVNFGEANWMETPPLLTARNIYLAATNAVVCYDENSLTSIVRYVPPLYFSSINETRSGNGSYDIGFTAIDYRNADGIRYAYRVVPASMKEEVADTIGWIEIGREHRIAGLSKPAGNYRLEVRSTDAYGQWCDNRIIMPLSFRYSKNEILLAAFYIILAILLCAGTFVVIRMRRRATKLLNETMEGEIAQAPALSEVDEDAEDTEDKEFVNQIDNYLSEHLLDKDFYIQQVADNFGMSRTIFYRRLRAITGLAPVEYVRNFRIRHACQLLHDPKYSIADVAYLCGFGTPQSFNKTFKEVKNCSPGEFRSKIVQNDQNG